MNEEEHWRQIPGFSAYEASTLGNIRRVVDFTGPGRRWPLPHTLKLSGEYIALRDDEGSYRQVRVARIIARVWIGKPPFNSAVAKHYDRDASNNEATNLAWALRPGRRADDRHGRRWMIVAKFAGVC